MRPAARLLTIEGEALGAVLARADGEAFDLPTVCTGWSVRDVLAHCGAALTAASIGALHRFTPEDNERDVAERRAWPLEAVIAELRDGYAEAARAVDRAGGAYDGIAIGEWMHGGDVREPLGEPDPYCSAGVELAIDLLAERSVTMARPAVDVHLPGRVLSFGAVDAERPRAELRCDQETFVRLCGGRGPDPGRYHLVGAAATDLVLFS